MPKAMNFHFHRHLQFCEVNWSSGSIQPCIIKVSKTGSLHSEALDCKIYSIKSIIYYTEFPKKILSLLPSLHQRSPLCIHPSLSASLTLVPSEQKFVTSKNFGTNKFA